MRTFEEIRNEIMAIQDKWFDEWHATGVKPEWDYSEERTRIMEEWHKDLNVGDHVHVHLYTDVDPATVIKRTPTSITVRHDKATLDPDWKPEWIAGGFAGHCVNQNEQRWFIEEDPDGGVETFRWSKKTKCYQRDGVKVFPEWRKFYDYNF